MLVLLALTLAPVAAVLIFVYHHDRHEREPAVHMAVCLALGIVAMAVAVVLELGAQRLGFDGATSVTMTFGFAFVVVGLSEEGSKFVALRIYAYRQREFNEPYDGIIYAVLVSMGFASVENLLYVLGPGNVGDGTRIALLRMFTAVPAHGAYGVLMGYFVGLAKFRPGRARRLQALGLLVAVAAHGLYDVFLFTDAELALGGYSILVLVVALAMSWRAIRDHRDSSPFAPPAD